jgi:hypothetical protein
MSRMLDLIRASALPSHQMMTASKGALHVPAAEMVEILVYLAQHNKIFGETARLTLAGWDEQLSKTIAADPKTAKEILDYWLLPNTIRPVLFPILIENSSVSMTKLSELAGSLKNEFIDAMIASPRVQSSSHLLQEFTKNHHLTGVQNARVQALIEGKPAPIAISEGTSGTEIPPPVLQSVTAEAVAETRGPSSELVPNLEPSQSSRSTTGAEPATLAVQPTADVSAKTAEPDDPEAESALVAFFAEHASEIAAEADRPFQPIGGIYEEMPAEFEPKVAARAASAPAGAPTTTPAVLPTSTPHPGFHSKLVSPHEERRGTVLQKIAKLDIKGRIQLAMRGTKEERSILIRDGTKLVALAVLESPKISDGEVEKFATQKNVLEAVLRAIPMKRRFAKNYAIVRNLVFNPRTPLDVALGLMKNLLTADLKHLSGNKEVSETVRKLALRMFKQKVESAKKD